jgi:hypothetical protein
MRNMKHAKNILSCILFIFVRFILDKKCFSFFLEQYKAEVGAQNGLKPNQNEVLKLKTTKNLQILEKPVKPAL